MDSPYENSGQNVPGVKPGTIASGSDDTPLPFLGVPNGVIGNASSRRPTGGRPVVDMNRLNSDIVLDGGGGPKKTNKSLIIVGVIAIVVLIVVGIITVIVMNGNNNKNVSTNKTVALSDVTKFMLFGDIESTSEISEIELDDAVFIQVGEAWTYDKQQEYFGKLKEYLNDLNGNDNGLSADVALFEKLSAIGYVDALWTIYLANGTDGVQDYVSEIGNMDVNSDVSSDITTIAEELGVMSGKIYTEYKEKGCVKQNEEGEKELDDECVTTIYNNNADLVEMIGKISKLRMKVKKNVDRLGEVMFAKVMALNGLQEKIEEVPENE